MTEFEIPPSTPTALDAIRSHADRIGVTRVARSIHRWASPAWQDLPALLRTIRDGAVLIAIAAMATVATAVVALVAQVQLPF